MTVVERKLYIQGKMLDALNYFIGAMGYQHVPTNNVYRRFKCKALKHCSCGATPVLMDYMYRPGGWIVQCPGCSSRTVDKDSPTEAVKAWNTDEFTEETLITRQPLDLDEAGANALIAAMKKDALDDIAAGEKSGKLDTQSVRNAKWFIKDKKMIKYVESGEYRKRLAEEAKKRKEAEK